MSDEYDVQSIQVLSSVEAVRRRPGMFLGSTGPEAILHLALQLVSASVEEAGAGHAKYIRVSVDPVGAITVADDGRGIPVDTSVAGVPQFPRWLTELLQREREVSIFVANAVAARFEVTADRPEGRFRQVFEAGLPLGPASEEGPPSGTSGTRVRWLPDPAIFGEARLDRAALKDALEDVAKTVDAVISLDGERLAVSAS